MTEAQISAFSAFYRRLSGFCKLNATTGDAETNNCFHCCMRAFCCAPYSERDEALIRRIIRFLEIETEMEAHQE